MQDATSLAATIASGVTTAAAVMEAALHRAEAVYHLGLLARTEPELGRTGTMTAPPGPFQGVPFLGKDLGSGAAGLTNNAGSFAMRKRFKDGPEDDDLFARFRSGGLVPFGLTVVPEFGLTLTSDPARNPWNPRLSPGGSSGGAAGAVAAGIVAMAHATDAAGSIRVPAACCGLVGLKPSRGSVPTGPFFGNHLMGLGTELVLARSVRDVATAFALMDGYGDSPPAQVKLSDKPVVGLTIPRECSPAQAGAAVRAADCLIKLGGRLKFFEPSTEIDRWSSRIARLILSVSMAEWLQSYQVTDDEVSPLSAAVAAEGRGVSAMDLYAASREMAQLTDVVRHYMTGTDVIVSPVLSGPPPALAHFDMFNRDVSAHFSRMEAMAPDAALANVTGLPALVVPFGFEEGLPIGVQLFGRLGTDLALLNLGARLESQFLPLTFPYSIAGHP